VLNHERLPDHFDIDRHLLAIIGRRRSTGDMVRWTATTVPSLGQGEEPACDVDFFDLRMNDVAVCWILELLLSENIVVHIVLSLPPPDSPPTS
jgi:hypothetical protein